jgi:hypothetical protein
VQRFTPGGRLEAVIWAHSPRVVVPVTEETE